MRIKIFVILVGVVLCSHVVLANNEFQLCRCTSNVVAPVCGEDGITYNSDCQARCGGTSILHRGKCSESGNGCACLQKNYDPVCGVNGKTYSNVCEATCASVEVDYSGECKDLNKCVCPMNYFPVCATDAQTYSNACVARCFGQTTFSLGKCDSDGNASRIIASNACFCTPFYSPVCGKNGRTYANACFAECDHMPLDHAGRC